MQRSAPRTALPRATDRLSLGEWAPGQSDLPGDHPAGDRGSRLCRRGELLFCQQRSALDSLYAPDGRDCRLLASGVQRDEIVIAGVSYLHEPLFGYFQFDELISAIPGIERIDVLIAGAVEASDFISRYEKLVRAKQRKMWGCRAIGASFHSRAAALMAISSDLLDISYIRYNAAHAGAESEIFPYISLNRRGLLYNFKSMDGNLTESSFQALNLESRYKCPKPTDGYRFALSRPELDGLLVAPETPVHVEALASALAAGPLPAARVEYMKKLWQLATGRGEVERA